MNVIYYFDYVLFSVGFHLVKLSQVYLCLSLAEVLNEHCNDMKVVYAWLLILVTLFNIK
jgi:hypothetical protein